MSRPTVVLVPGAWHTPEIYDKVKKSLESCGYDCIALHLPSVGAMPPNEDFTEDVAAIRSCVANLVKDEKEVVVVLHSYSGLPGGEAFEGLGRKERQQQGEQGGVTRLVFIAALALPEDSQLVAKGDWTKFPAWMKVDVKAGIVTVDHSDAKRIFYHDLTDAEASYRVQQLQHQSLGVYASRSTYAAWRYIPSTFLMGKDDQSSLNAAAVDAMLQGARQISPAAFDVVEYCDGGHCLMTSQPEWTVQAIRRASGDNV